MAKVSVALAFPWCLKGGSSTWPPVELRELMGSEEWQLRPVQAGLPRQSENRFHLDDACRSTSNSPQFSVCVKAGWCDDYSAGSGYCPVYPAENVDVRLQNGSTQMVLARSDHCMALGGNGSHMFLCPPRAPIAIIMNPKAGSTSAAMWLQLLTSLRRPRALVRHFRNNLAKGELGISEHWLFGAEGIGGRKRLRRKQRAALQQRMLFEVLIDGSTMRVAEYASKILLPPGWCIPCCAHASGRLPVVLVRNPFRRVQSWFRHKWLANKGKEPYATWAGFLPFLRYMWEHRSDANDPNGFWKRVLKRPFNMLDVAHTMSFRDILEDPRWPQEAAARLRARRIFPLRLEVMSSDFAELRRILCQRLGFCKGLPAIPHVVPRGFRAYLAAKPPSMQELWSSEALEIMWRMFDSDFSELGYSRDALVEKPISLPTPWATCV
ncbi:unnamed protein product [Effrenium voratum]|uniref:Sulfotransferase n=1 Tax=Effrenium voratum TaxID=2562239 RepID=A0AA36HTZ8_9DINO|nr:unnamed protein product [Effrenium voratum]CAJ1450585.1 unnamed protein product [Effrenium voratum]